jgi:spoIIIJ-associated protein
MIKEFEGKSEKEAIDNAVAELNLDREQFDVEIMESTKGGIFRKGNVKIRVYLQGESRAPEAKPAGKPATRASGKPAGRSAPKSGFPAGGGSTTDPQPQDEFETKLIEFIETVTKKMGYPGRANIAYREPNKVGFNIDSEHSGILIGKKGKNLDSLQLLANIYAGRLDEGRRVVVDAEDYRSRHEDNIIRDARRTAAQVRKSKRSRLLEPMNPFERRLVHTTLNDMNDIETKSEGEGLYKQVRIIFRGADSRRY